MVSAACLKKILYPGLVIGTGESLGGNWQWTSVPFRGGCIVAMKLRGRGRNVVGAGGGKAECRWGGEI